MYDMILSCKVFKPARASLSCHDLLPVELSVRSERGCPGSCLVLCCDGDDYGHPVMSNASSRGPVRQACSSNHQGCSCCCVVSQARL